MGLIFGEMNNFLVTSRRPATGRFCSGCYPRYAEFDLINQVAIGLWIANHSWHLVFSTLALM